MKYLIFIFYTLSLSASCHNPSSAEISSNLVVSRYKTSDMSVMLSIKEHAKLLKKEIELLKENQNTLNFRNSNDIDSYLDLKETTEMMKSLFQIY